MALFTLLHFGEVLSSTFCSSHFLSVPPGTRIISDALLSSPILREDLPAGMDDAGAVATAGQAGGSGGFEFDVDPSLDPELAMVKIPISISSSETVYDVSL